MNPPPSQPSAPARLEGPFWPKRPGILEHYSKMTLSDIAVFDVLGLDVVTRPWFRPDDPSTHYTTLSVREISSILSHAKSSVGRSLKALVERKWLTRSGKQIYIKKYLRLTGKVSLQGDSGNLEKPPVNQEVAEKVSLQGDSKSTVPPGGQQGDRSVPPEGQPYKVLKALELVKSKSKSKDKSKIYDDSIEDLIAVLDERDEKLKFNIGDFFSLVASRLGVVDQEGKPYPKAFPKADKKALFHYWTTHGPFAREIVEQALESSKAQQVRKGKPLPLGYHLKAIANLQAEKGKSYNLLKEDAKAKRLLGRLADKITGRAE